MPNIQIYPSSTCDKFGRVILAGILIFLAAAGSVRADVVVINAAIVCMADVPQDVVTLGSGISTVNISGSIALWEIGPVPSGNTASQMQLFLNSPFAQSLANGALPPIIPFLSDVRCVRITLEP